MSVWANHRNQAGIRSRFESNWNLWDSQRALVGTADGCPGVPSTSNHRADSVHSSVDSWLVGPEGRKARIGIRCELPRSGGLEGSVDLTTASTLATPAEKELRRTSRHQVNHD